MTQTNQNRLQLILIMTVVFTATFTTLSESVSHAKSLHDQQMSTSQSIQVTPLQNTIVFVSNDTNIYSNLRLTKVVYHVNHTANYLPVTSTKRAVINNPQQRSSTYVYVISNQDHHVRGWVDVKNVALSC
ncbi:hypothetical protein [Lentilactobacillus kisonensis]|uniref:Uncharacterized protein n=2 Tax=Lentilactobacillus kisonensis TaxID=481722 RepID=H1LCF5_9LACO|nr:hypothetical protein [Lentilactobacillus kisonensis]EHO54100.1 hypothetical protein HMPREF9104_00268 [Lentilactobacillus kisonensis F0435]KRL22643.1 hypothetical protein FC98_GL002242 [Lentilactobacillus kisonensis DSM 19906 = JCM 15041]